MNENPRAWWDALGLVGQSQPALLCLQTCSGWAGSWQGTLQWEDVEMSPFTFPWLWVCFNFKVPVYSKVLVLLYYTDLYLFPPSFCSHPHCKGMLIRPLLPVTCADRLLCTGSRGAVVVLPVAQVQELTGAWIDVAFASR